MTVRAIITGLLLTGVSAFSQTCPTGLTPVADTIYAPAAGPGATRLFSGSVTISIATPLTVGSVTYGRIPYVINVVRGAFSVCLAPNDTAIPTGTGYTVKYEHHDAQGTATWGEVWSVPTSASPVKVNSLRYIAPLSPGAQIPTGGAAGVTSLATSGPITGGTITSSGTLACPTCVTATGTLTSHGVMVGAGSKGSAALVADTATTHALFSTAGDPAFRAIQAADIPTLNQNTSGNAATATALAANGANCSAGSFPLGVDASGNAETCTAVNSIGVANSQLTAPIRAGGFTVLFRGSDASAGTTIYLTMPYACTITDWAITADSTATVKLWRLADGGTAQPTVTNTLSTSGFALSSGTRIHSTTLADLSSTAIAAYDTFAINLFASAASYVAFTLGCQR